MFHDIIWVKFLPRVQLVKNSQIFSEFRSPQNGYDLLLVNEIYANLIVLRLEN